MKCLKLTSNLTFVLAFALFSLSLMSIGIVPGTAEAQTLFFDDFEGGTLAWTGTGVITQLVIVDHAGSMRMMQQANGGDATGNAIPDAIAGNTDWTNYSVEADITWDDDDQWGIIVRYTDEDNWYNVEVDQNNCHEAGTEAAAEWRIEVRTGGADPVTIGSGPAPCPSSDSIDEGGELLVPVSVDIHTYQVTVMGSDITLFIDGVEMGTASDSDHPSGTAGIRYETIVGTVDNFHVYGPGGPTAVEAKGKVATTWGQLKARY